MNASAASPSQPSKTPPNSPPPATPELSPQERQELTALRREKAALSAMLWNLVRQAYPETHDAEVMPAAEDPLWQIAFVQSSDAKSGRVRILAGTILPITESEKKRVVRLLRGTATPMHAALAELKLERFPPSYVEEQIKDYLVWRAAAITGDTGAHPSGVINRWISAKPPTFGENVRNFLHFPKS